MSDAPTPGGAEPTGGDPQGGNEPEPKPEPGKTFAQEDVDRIVADRLKRERDKYAGYDDLKQKAEAYDQLEEAKKTEIQKATDKATAEEKARIKAENALREERVGRVLEKALTAAGAIDADAASLGDRSLLEFDDDGVPKKSSVTKFVKDLQERKAYLFGGRGSWDGGARPSAPSGDMNARIREAARR